MTRSNGSDWILWLGWTPRPAGGAHEAVSPAAARWQGLFTTHLSTHVELARLGYRAYQSWPLGPFLGNSGMWRNSTSPAQGHQYPYINVRGLRQLHLARGTLQLGKAALEVRGNIPRMILTYNVYPYLWIAASILRSRWRVPWINIRADYVRMERVAKRGGPDGVVYLSYGSYLAHRGPIPAFHLLGGVESVASPSPTVGRSHEHHVAMYAGSLNEHAGLPLLLKGMNHCGYDKLDLWVAGRGEERVLREAAQADERIVPLGFLCEEELTSKAQDACFFVNPRPSDRLTTACDFPSKLLFYLDFGKPILSTVTSGLTPQFVEALDTTASTPIAMGSALERMVNTCGSAEAVQRAEKVSRLASQNLWENRVADCVKWMEEAFA